MHSSGKISLCGAGSLKKHGSRTRDCILGAQRPTRRSCPRRCGLRAPPGPEPSRHRNTKRASGRRRESARPAPLTPPGGKRAGPGRGPTAAPPPGQDGGTPPSRRYARTAAAPRRKRKWAGVPAEVAVVRGDAARRRRPGPGPGPEAAAAPRMWRLLLLLALAWLGRALPAGAAAEQSGGGQPRWDGDGAGSAQGGGSAVRYRTAEMADAALGSGLPAQHAPLLSVVPGEAGDGRAPAAAAAAGGCDAAAGGDACGAGSGPGREQAGLETVLPAPAEEPNGTDSAKAPKVNCEERNVTGIDRFTLQILNVSQDLMEFLNTNSSDCTLVLFYTPWCRFSASLAPHFNSLPRAFPTLRFLALDASQHSSLSTRFGTVAVPNILLFQGAKPMARFNHTDRTLETLKDFIFNQTGIEAKSDVAVTEEDWEGPLPSVLTKGIDWLLLFSLLFLASFVMYATVRTESIRWLIPGQEHEHQE
ncbi:thioredoxin domain-containing protein 15 [Morus bassanus]